MVYVFENLSYFILGYLFKENNILEIVFDLFYCYFGRIYVEVVFRYGFLVYYWVMFGIFVKEFIFEKLKLEKIV